MQVKNILSRKRLHFSDLKLNKHKNKNLQEDYNLYGKNCFNLIPIILCEKEELLRYEQYFLDVCKGNLYNIAVTAGCKTFKGLCHTEDTKKLISKNRKGKGLVGIPRDEETKRKISIKHKGNKYNLGKKSSEIKRKKISLGLRKYKQFSNIWKQMKHNGQSYGEIAKKYNTNKVTVYNYINKYEEIIL